MARRCKASDAGGIVPTHPLRQTCSLPAWHAGRMGDSSAESAVGKTGRVTTRIAGGKRPGEVSVAIRGGVEWFIAYSDEEIAINQAVLVVSSRGGREVDVTPFP